MGFDFNSVTVVTDALPMQVIHPTTGEPIEGMIIHLYGVDSPVYQKKEKAIQRRLRQKFMVNRNYVPSDGEELENGLDLLSVCTAGWEGIDNQGEPYPFSQENAKKLYAAAPWLKRQVDQFIGSHANFMQVSGNNQSGG